MPKNVRKILRNLALAAFAAVLVKPVMAEEIPADLIGAWHVETIAGKATDPDVKTWLEFEGAGTVDGSGGCNSLFGAYSAEGGTFRIGPLAVTRKACPPKILGQEKDFLKAVPAVRDFRLEAESQVLVLLNGSGEEVMRLAAEK